MKILVQGIKNNHVAGFQYYAEQRKHQWVWWEESHTPAFDVFDEVKPRLYIGVGEQSIAVQRCLRETNVPSIIEIEPFNYVVRTSYEQLPNIIGEGLNCGILVNDRVYQPQEPDPKFACDIAYCGPLNPMVMQLCYPIGKYHIKIAGECRWPVAQYIGMITLAQKIKLYNSAKAVYTDDMEEAIRAIACNTLVLTHTLEVQAAFPKFALAVSSFCWKFPPKNELGRAEILRLGLTYQSAFETLSKICEKYGINL